MLLPVAMSHGMILHVMSFEFQYQIFSIKRENILLLAMKNMQDFPYVGA